MIMRKGDRRTMETKKKKLKANDIAFYIFMAVCIILILMLNFVARPVSVNGSSMEHTYTDGDFVIIYQWGYEPERGDVVVINKGGAVEERLIKRVIGIGGDVIRIEDSSIYVNGEKLDEPYIAEAEWNYGSIQVEVPEGAFYFLGDNRNHSLDSRIIGTLPTDQIKGKVVYDFK